MNIRYTSLFLTIFVFSFTQLFGQNSLNGYYAVEIKLKPSQTLESITEMYPFLNVKSSGDNKLAAEIPPKYLNTIRSGDLEFKILSTLKTNYITRNLSKAAGTPNPIIQNMVNNVSSDSIRTNILALQNFGTRYEYTPTQDSAGVYIYNQFQRWGLQASYDPYKFGTTTIYDIDFVNENLGWLVGTGGMIVKTTDGGQNWINNNSGTTAEFYGIDMLNNSTGWAVGQSGYIRKTTDGGATWVSQTSGQSVSLYDVGFVNDQLGLIVGASGRILRTTNGGTNWTSINSGTTQTLRELQFVDSLKAWAVGTGGTILKTTDGGLNWSFQTLTPSTTNYLRAVCFIDTLYGWAVGEGSLIYKTTDGGTNWINKSAPSGIGSILRGISFINSLQGWLVDYDGRIWATTDGGESWVVQHEHLGWTTKLLNVQAFNNNSITVSGVSGNIFHTTNGGTNWIGQTNHLPVQYLHQSNNIVATIIGTISPEKECVIVAHYDSYSNNPYVSAPGANDNGTGTTAVMEAARLCSGKQFENTIKFVAVSGEEMGMFGSDHYAFQAYNESRNIIGAVNGDMIGYPTTADTARLIIGSYMTINRLVDSAAIYNQRYGIGLTLVPAIDNTGASDYGPFAIAGYDALDIAEGTAEEIWGGADPYYHQTTDTYDKLNPGMIRKGVQLMLSTVAELAKPYTYGIIEGKIYNDINRDSSSNGDEAMNGWIVKLFKNGILQERKVTDINGSYIFEDLSPDIYTIEESLRVDWIQSLPRISEPVITYTTYGNNAAPRAYEIMIELNSRVTADFANYPSWMIAKKYGVSSGWNIISIPFETANKLKMEIFPTSISSAYKYNNGYEVKDTLECGVGYWLKFNSDTLITITGTPMEADTIVLYPGWNMIGTLNDSISVSSLITEPDGILSSNFYGYDHGYITSYTLEPMKGYWIKANSTGELMLTKP
jgi:photosystem II stability/assembly factor-like uncharacterized protein